MKTIKAEEELERLKGAVRWPRRGPGETTFTVQSEERERACQKVTRQSRQRRREHTGVRGNCLDPEASDSQEAPGHGQAPDPQSLCL